MIHNLNAELEIGVIYKNQAREVREVHLSYLGTDLLVLRV
jgi:hypothetical protein